MDPNILPSASLFLGVIPALLLLYISLKGYEGLYKEKTIYLTFVIGLILGVVAVIIEAFTMGAGVFLIILFPILEQLLKTIVLNSGRLQEKKETVVYGLSLGLGFGSIFIPFSLIRMQLPTISTFTGVFWVVIGSLGLLLMQAATGVCIGYGVYAKKLSSYVVYAVMMEIPVTFTGLINPTTWLQSASLQIIVLAYGVFVYWYITTRFLPRILPDYRKRQRHKKQRKIL